MSLVGGIVLLVLGIILYAISSLVPPAVTRLCQIAGIILAIIGVVLIILAALGVAIFL